jgi:hypothetical protein
MDPSLQLRVAFEARHPHNSTGRHVEPQDPQRVHARHNRQPRPRPDNRGDVAEGRRIQIDVALSPDGVKGARAGLDFTA